ncbi:MAG TPA: HEAT repeat domain-containing protein [Polyangia bacterium]|nr:HEAT repeat domain-containing protein [Polyangia bacterium]
MLAVALVAALATGAPAKEKRMGRFEDAVAQLRSSETWCRGARTLAQLGDKRAVAPLVAALRSRAEADKVCLLDALEALGAEAYARTLARSSDAAERAVGVRLMESFPTDEQIAPLVDLALHDGDAELRRAAAATLALQRRTPAWLAASVRLLDADDAAVRGATIDSMAMQNSDATRQALAARLAHEKDPELVKKLRAATAPRR